MSFLAKVNWKRTYALTVVYGYMYQIIFWPFAFWAMTLLAMEVPPIIPWEQLAVATANLAVVGGVQFMRDKTRPHRRVDADEIG